MLGKKIVPIISDGKSNWSHFAKEAERLIVEEKVSVIFGCWTSACRKTIKPIIEKHNHLLFYPIQYEGLEQSPNIIYTGATPNQQIIPAVKWAFENLGKKFFLVGSDYIFPRTANFIIKDQLKILGGEVLGEEYVSLGSTQFEKTIEKIRQTKPDVILNTINGDSNIAFFQKLRKSGIISEETPTISFSIAENEIQKIGVHNVVNDYASWNYFQNIKTENNQNFVKKIKSKSKGISVLNDPMESVYISFKFWVHAVEKAGTPNTLEVMNKLKGISLMAPEGYVYLDPRNKHTWKTSRIGKIQSDGNFKIIWSSSDPVRPLPFLRYRSKLEWEQFLSGLYRQWDNNWENPRSQASNF